MYVNVRVCVCVCVCVCVRAVAAENKRSGFVPAIQAMLMTALQTSSFDSWVGL